MDWHERGWFVYDALRTVAARSQGPVRAYLRRAGARYTPHWAVNAIYVRGGSRAVVEGVAALEGVAQVRLPRTYRLHEPVEEALDVRLPSAPSALEWGVGIIQAPQVWAEYTRGEGVVVANIDTGVRYTHNALAGQYRGSNGDGTFDHDYNWYDPQGGAAPSDEHGHGTHTMGTMVGDDGGSNQVGVAPGTRWIAADGCQSNDCPDADLISSAEWMLAPCPVGVAPGSPSCDPDMRPQVVNNSWGECGTRTTDFYEAQIDAWRAAGIVAVFSAGNTGNCEYGSPFCSSLSNPARHYQVTSVGATDSGDNVAYFSLWGPTDDADPRLAAYADLKPEVSAPGQSVRSASSKGDATYRYLSGTSMAAPHVAGTVALVLSAVPGLWGQVDAVEDLLKESADPIPYSTGCGNEGPGDVPNNAAGWGRVNALQAVEQALSTVGIPWLGVHPSSGTVTPGGSMDVAVRFDAAGLGPGVYTGTLRVRHDDPATEAVDVALTMTVVASPPMFSLARVARADLVEVGTALTYTLRLENGGGQTFGVVVSDALPSGTLFAWAREGGSAVGDEVVWSGLTADAGGALTLSYGVTVTCVPSGTDIVSDRALVYASQWPTPTWSGPLTVTAVSEGVSAAFESSLPALVDWPVSLANLSQNASIYRWDLGDGTYSSASQPSHTYRSVGEFTVVLTAANACDSATVSDAIAVEQYAAEVATPSGRGEGLPGTNVTYTLRVTNVGSLDGAFGLSVSGQSWPVQVSPSQAPLNRGQAMTATVLVSVPVAAPARSQDVAWVTALAIGDPRPAAPSARTAVTTTSLWYEMWFPHAMVDRP
jgi:uncharacterized repeat protein (TIGR01451 family)